MPGRPARVRALEHDVHRIEIVLAARAVAVIVRTGLPALEGIVEALGELLILLLLRHMDEDFHDRVAAIDLLRLELVDLVIGAFEIALAAEFLHLLDQHAAIPAAIEHSDVLVGREPGPEAPEEVMAPLFLARRGDRPDLVIARIEQRGHALDDAALAGSIPSLEHHDAALVVHDMGDLNPLEPLLEALQLRIEIAIEMAALFEVGQVDGHRGSPINLLQG